MVSPPYLVAFSADAEAYLCKADKALRKQLGHDIYLLQLDPYREGTKKLKGKVNKKVAYRLRSGDYRVLYHIEAAYVLIDVVKIGHRKDAYK
jgi:mRNA interferase RelE/StbE